jgi:hypothetical protein
MDLNGISNTQVQRSLAEQIGIGASVRDLSGKQESRSGLKTITVDPDGYVVLRFHRGIDEANFLKNLVGKVTGTVFGKLRASERASDNRVTIKLSDFEAPFDLPLP